MRNKLFAKLVILSTAIMLFAGFSENLINNDTQTVLADKSKGKGSDKGKSKSDKDKSKGSNKDKGKGKDKDKSKDPDDKENKDKSSSDSSGDGGDGKDNYSFYHLASSAATYFDASTNPDTKVAFQDVNVSFNNAGGLLGYEDKQYDKHNWIGSITSFLSNSASGHSYNAFQSSDMRGVYYYALYGHALTAMGLDSTAPRMSIGSMFRFIGGFFMMIAYAMAVSVSFIFDAILKILQALNPFQFFLGIGSDKYNTSMSSWMSSTARSADKHMNGILGDAFATGIGRISNEVTALFTQAQGFGLDITVPFLIIFGLLFWVLFNFKPKGRLKKFFLRLLVIVAGVPIMGSLYTDALDNLEKTNTSDISANVILGSTFDDFESWASKTRLALPQGTKITLSLDNSPAGDISDNTNGGSNATTDVRTLSLKINQIANNGLVQSSSDSTYDENSIWTDTKSASDLQSVMGPGFSLLGRYMTSAKYTAADYETLYKSHLDNTTHPTKKEIFEGIKYLANNPDAFKNDRVGKGEGQEDNGTKGKSKGKDDGSDKTSSKGYFFPGTEPKSKDNGKVDFLWNSNGGVLAHQDGVAKQGDVSQSKVKDNPVTFTGYGVSGSDKWGLSTLSLYNYLTTEFTDSNVTIYSMSKANSMMVASSHQSVNLVGTSTTSIAFFVNALILFAAIAILGWGYALAMLMQTVSNEFKMIIHAPFAAMGSLNGAAKFVTATLTVIGQILITIFIYSLSVDMLMALNLGTSPVLQGAAQQTTGTDGSGGMINLGAKFGMAIQSHIFADAAASHAQHNMGTLVYLIIVSVITALFAFMMLKTRSAIVKAYSEWIGNLVDRIFMQGSYGDDRESRLGSGITAARDANGDSNLQKGLNGGMAAGHDDDNNNNNNNSSTNNTNHSNSNNTNNNKQLEGDSAIQGGQGDGKKDASGNMGVNGAEKQNMDGIPLNGSDNDSAKDANGSAASDSQASGVKGESADSQGQSGISDPSIDTNNANGSEPGSESGQDKALKGENGESPVNSNQINADSKSEGGQAGDSSRDDNRQEDAGQDQNNLSAEGGDAANSQGIDRSNLSADSMQDENGNPITGSDSQNAENLTGENGENGVLKGTDADKEFNNVKEGAGTSQEKNNNNQLKSDRDLTGQTGIDKAGDVTGENNPSQSVEGQDSQNPELEGSQGSDTVNGQDGLNGDNAIDNSQDLNGETSPDMTQDAQDNASNLSAQDSDTNPLDTEVGSTQANSETNPLDNENGQNINANNMNEEANTNQQTGGDTSQNNIKADNNNQLHGQNGQGENKLQDNSTNADNSKNKLEAHSENRQPVNSLNKAVNNTPEGKNISNLANNTKQAALHALSGQTAQEAGKIASGQSSPASNMQSHNLASAVKNVVPQPVKNLAGQAGQAMQKTLQSKPMQTMINAGLKSNNPTVKAASAVLKAGSMGQNSVGAKMAMLPNKTGDVANNHLMSGSELKQVAGQRMAAHNAGINDAKHLATGTPKNAFKFAKGAVKSVYAAGVLAQTGNSEMAGKIAKSGLSDMSGAVRNTAQTTGSMMSNLQQGRGASVSQVKQDNINAMTNRGKAERILNPVSATTPSTPASQVLNSQEMNQSLTQMGNQTAAEDVINNSKGLGNVK